MSPSLAGGIGIVLMLVLMFCGFNLPFTFIISGVVGITMMMGFDLGISFLKTIPLTSAMSYSLAVLPMFMLMGDFAVSGGLTTDAYGAARRWLGRLPGGLAVTSTVASALFGAICGSGQATAMVMSQVAWPEMKRYGYAPKIGLTSIAAAGPLAILIPPSTPLIMYSILASVSVGSLFMAGWLPGILLTIILCVVTIVMVLVKPSLAPRAEKSSLKDKVKSLGKAAPILVLILLMMYCIWGGVTTVNEAAGLSVVCTLIIILAKRRANFKAVLKTLRDSTVMCAALFFMFVGIQVFNTFLSMSGLPAKVTALVTGLNVAPMVIIWAIFILYLILGCFMDTPVIMMLTIPILAPAVAALGFDLTWFGIFTAMTVALGSITPPVGICLFVIAARVPDVPLSSLMKNIWPYVVGTVIATIIVMYVPELATWLPSLMIG